MNKRIYSAGSVLFRFTCLKCSKKVEVNIFEVLHIGTPMCCDEEMDININCIVKEK